MPAQYAHYPQYVPIIKWQKWEQKALEMTEPAVAQRVLPCIEVRTSAQHRVLLEKLDAVWNYPALIDYADPHGNLTPSRLKELKEFLKLTSVTASQASPILNSVGPTSHSLRSRAALVVAKSRCGFV